MVQGIRAELHQHRPHHRGRLQRPRAERRRVLGLRRGHRLLQGGHLAVQGQDRSLVDRRAPRADAGEGEGRRLREHDARARRRRTATLQHPNCVYQIMRRHYARYTPEMVERVTGCPKETFLKVADALARNSGRERTGAFCYAVGWTHHSVGRADHPRGDHHPGPAGQRRPARRRHHGAARPLSASRARPTSRRSTTCCRPTCRSRTSSTSTARSKNYLDVETPHDRLVGQLPQIHGQPAEGLVRRARDAPTTSGATSSSPS